MSALAQSEPQPRPMTDAERELVKPWKRRATEARDDRKAYETQWQINQLFCAGVQWLAVEPVTGRVLEDPSARERDGRTRDVVDVLSQYRGTAMGKLAAGDLRPELLASYENDEQADAYTEQLNDAVAFAWEEECHADQKAFSILRALTELGTAALRCRYDRSQGKLLATEVPHVNGRPLLDPIEARQHVAQLYAAGMSADLRPLREGRIVWEKLSAWNLLPPPGIEDPADFPWEIIIRPVHKDELIAVYGAKAQGLKADRVEDMGMLAYAQTRNWQRTNQTSTPATAGNLREHVLVCTGYERPSLKHPNGQTVVFTFTSGALLDSAEGLPYNRDPWGARSGVTYFRWDVLEGRFWGRAFVEPGIGPQKIRNKRLSQIDETIDRGQVKVFAQRGSVNLRQMKGSPVEFVWIEEGAPIPRSDGGIQPGPWMKDDLETQDDNLEKALGLRGISLGTAPAGVSAYSAMALISENDAQKLDPIAQQFQLGIAHVVRDTVEAMGQWPANKQLLIAGDENRLRVASFDAKKSIPPAYLVRPAKGGTLPRSQAAQVQKIADVANYAATVGAAQQDPLKWLDWYVRSLDAGQLQELPREMSNEQQHKAALENVVMVTRGVPVPVAEYDDANVHVPEHREEQMRLAQAAAEGDTRAGLLVQVIELHVQAHLAQAQTNAQVNAANLQAAQPSQQPMLPPAFDVNQLQSPIPPRVRL